MKKPALQIRTSFTAPSAGVSKRKTPRSADLTSKLLQTPKNPVHLYLELNDKARKRNIKLDRFFGPNELRPRIDACTIREGFQYGLAGCLSSKRVLSYFFLYLLQVNSTAYESENRKISSKLCSSCSKWSSSRISSMPRSTRVRRLQLFFTTLIYTLLDCYTLEALLQQFERSQRKSLLAVQSSGQTLSQWHSTLPNCRSGMFWSRCFLISKKKMVQSMLF